MKICKGATRCVWLIGKLAIKFPRLCTWRSFLNGLLANMTEREFDCIAPELHAKVYLASKLGLWLVMERADGYINTVRSPDLEQQIKKLYEKCQSAGLPCERKNENIGVFKGVLKIIDFGS